MKNNRVRKLLVTVDLLRQTLRLPENCQIVKVTSDGKGNLELYITSPQFSEVPGEPPLISCMLSGPPGNPKFEGWLDETKPTVSTLSPG